MKIDQMHSLPSRLSPSWHELGFTCLFGSVVLYVFSRTLADPDLWGHIKFGQDLWRTATLVRADPYSYLSGDQLWINHEWLAEALFYGAFAAGGSTGLIAFKSCVSLLIAGIIYRHLRRQVSDALRAAILGVVFLLPLVPYLATVRPQAFTFLCFVLVLIALRDAEHGRNKWLWFVPVFLVFTVNLHGGFLAALGLFLLWVTMRLSLAVLRQRSLAAIFAQPHRKLLAVGTAGIVAALVNPYGAELLFFLLRTATVARPEIGEWRPVALNSFQGLVYALLIGLTLSGFILSKRERSPTLLILFICTALLPLSATRHGPLFGIAGAVIAGEHVGSAWDRWCPARISSGGDIARSSLIAKFCFGASLALVVLSALNFACIRINPRAVAVPAPAVMLLKQANIEGNLAIHFDWGEYALWHLGPRIKVSVDGRRETVYSAKIYSQNLNFMNGTGDWEAILRDYDTEFALVSKNFPVYNLLKLKTDWILAYDDPAAALFVRKGSPAIDRIRSAKIAGTPHDGAGLCFP